MRIVAERSLREYWESHADAEEPLQLWLREARAAQWSSPHDIKSAHPSLSILGNNRVCFNIKGNTYRLIVAVSYRASIVLIKFIGTHAEYSKIDAETVEMF